MLGFDKRAARYTWTAVAGAAPAVLRLPAAQDAVRFRPRAAVRLPARAAGETCWTGCCPAAARARPALALAYVFFVGILVFVGVPDRRAGGGTGQHPREGASRAAREMGAARLRRAGSRSIRSSRRCIEKIAGAGRATRSATCSASLPQAGVKLLSVAERPGLRGDDSLLAFFFLKDGASIRAARARHGGGRRRRDLVDDLMADVHLLLAHYMRALVHPQRRHVRRPTASASRFWGCRTRSCWPWWPRLLEFIPMIGPLAAAVPVIVMVTAVERQQRAAGDDLSGGLPHVPGLRARAARDGAGRRVASAGWCCSASSPARRWRASPGRSFRCRCWRWSGSSTAACARRGAARNWRPRRLPMS